MPQNYIFLSFKPKITETVCCLHSSDDRRVVVADKTLSWLDLLINSNVIVFQLITANALPLVHHHLKSVQIQTICINVHMTKIALKVVYVVSAGMLAQNAEKA